MNVNLLHHAPGLDSSAALSLRARALIGETERRRLARALRRLVDHAQRPRDRSAD